LDEGFLEPVRLLRRAETLERDDVLRADRGDRRDARARGFSVEENRAGAALGHAAAETWAAQLEIVAQDVEEGCVGLDARVACRAVYPQGIVLWHCFLLRCRGTGCEHILDQERLKCVMSDE